MRSRPNEPHDRERRFLRPSGFRRLAVGCALGAALVLTLAQGAGAVAAGVDVTAVEGQSLTGNVVAGLTCPLASATIT
jgi:hypothetical protein